MYEQNDHSKEPIRKESRIPTFIKRLQKFIIATMMIGVVGFNAGFVKEKSAVEIQEIYHVYADGAYLGAIEDHDQIEKLIENTLKQAQSQHEGVPLMIGTELSIVPERVFSKETNDEVVLEKLQNQLVVETKAIVVQAEGRDPFYVKDQASYDQLIRQLKLQSVSEEELAVYEARMTSEQPLPTLQENETRLAQIVLSTELQAVEGQVVPEQVLTVEEALTLLNKGTLVEKTYTIQAGDTIEKIAHVHHMTTAQLLELNAGVTTETLLQIGDTLHVTKQEPYVEVEVHYEGKRTETIVFNRVIEKDETMYKGDKKVKQQGADGKKEVIEYIRKKNGQVIGKSVVEETVLVEPTDEITVIGTKVIPSRGTGTFKWPTIGGYVSSKMGYRWGRVHQGIDIAKTSSSAILAADNGVVIKAGSHSTYGNHVVIRHNNGYETLYAHLSAIHVSVGQTIPQGTKIGLIGSTGRSTGVHLHFEVLKNGVNIDPLSVLK